MAETLDITNSLLTRLLKHPKKDTLGVKF